jgi:arylsulfatase A-like enzyme
MDRLAVKGIAFDRCITPSPLCTPSRAAIFSGLYAHQARGRLASNPYIGATPTDRNWGGISDMLSTGSSLLTEPKLTNLLRHQGYFTGYAGKWHLGSDVFGNWFDLGKEHNKEEYAQWCKANNVPDGTPFHDMRVRSKRYPSMSIPRVLASDTPIDYFEDTWITNHALKTLEARPRDKPFFMTCGFEGPHPPFKIPEPYFSMYDSDSIPEPPNFKPNDLEPESNKNSFYRKLWEDHGTDWDAWKKTVAVYRGFVTLIDDQIGRLIDYLEKEDELDNTLIIYASDHGEMLGQHGLWHKMHAYEESLRVPLIMSAPWIKGGTTCRQPASLIDIPSTILSQAGTDAPSEYQGYDLSRFFDGKDHPNDRKYVFSEFKNEGRFHGACDWRMVTDNAFKYTWNRAERDELYNLTSDPYERHNLTDDTQSQSVLAELRGVLKDWVEETNDPVLAVFQEESKSWKVQLG